MSGRPEPAMSVILITPDGYETIARTVSALRDQSAARRLELVIAAPALKTLAFPEVVRASFAGVRLVEIGHLKDLASAHAAGVRAATSPVVVFAEDHAFPEPGWAEALIATHEGPWVAVGPAMRNANPATLTSWADFLLGYGRWRVPAVAGATDHVPGHNSSYKRAALLDYGEKLVEQLQAPALLHADLAARGCRLYLEPDAVVSHMNFADMNAWLRLRFHAGRGFAAARARHWPASRRLVSSLAAPLVPFVRLVRIARESHRRDQPRAFFLRIVPVLWVGLVVDAAGEWLGYLAGPSRTPVLDWDWELHRERYG
jgi:GT2 family glycosyltransferase